MRDELRQMAPSLTEAVYLKLRKELLDCSIRPGEKLKIGDLAERFGVNLGSVRESLSRLTAEGLVTLESQKGFRAAPVSVADLQELTRARVEIEMLCFKASIAAGDVEWETRVVASFHRMIRTPEYSGGARPGRALNEAWATAHADFHFALVSACDNRWLLRMRDILYCQSERYRRLSIPMRLKSADERPSQQERDHRKLMDSALSRDVKKAAVTVAEHFGKTAALVAMLAAREDLGEARRHTRKSAPAARVRATPS